ncbi:hypothetical protein [Chryseolinea soli]|uniref:DUF4369 domain-containing protein n=1 Tax=Chryseolinea soli TaxID=2321403 RepID=A0A385SX84_9BACT|nr:hypothetical protein [Chryseolinea soli]AYB34340.1 hypothetical protein D4L85_28850 [Chryseolinea soli]
MDSRLKNTLLLAFLLACFPSVAQKQLQLTILTFSGDVTIGGQPVAAGQLVYDDSKNLLIRGKESYANILMETGYARKLGSGSYSPMSLNSVSASAKPQSFHAADYEPIVVLTAPRTSTPHTTVFGDSVFLLWEGAYSRKPLPPCTVSLLSMFDDHLLDTTSQSSFCALRVAPFFLQEKAIVIQVKSGQARSSMHVAAKMDEEMRLRIQNDLQTLVANTGTQRAIARLAIFEINELIYDVTYGLYKLRMAEKAAGVPIVSYYYQRLLKKYGMDTL